jgi:hypothetical protein
MPRSQKVNWKWSHKNYDIPRPPADRQLPRLCDRRPGNHCLYVFFINSFITDRKHGEREKKDSESFIISSVDSLPLLFSDFYLVPLPLAISTDDGTLSFNKIKMSVMVI